MKKTKHFEKLSKETQEIINKFGVEGIPDAAVMRKLHIEENRSVLFEIVDKAIILKVFLTKGKRDKDIDALIDLDGIEYFPKLYAYHSGEYLFMEKAQGLPLPEYFKQGASIDDVNKFRDLLLDAFIKMVDRNRRDWDFKLEHVFWSQETKKLTWIDLGCCETYSPLSQIKEKDIEEFSGKFEKRFLMSGIRIYY
ncbi:hypothetical protein ACFSO7_06895 [Bacillus sp. CGMCC 1.16607]|uniref:hypothetical protein n=1 Tax=Bacillus sp. CGMCC 1.16607 TaxID=3351842 RepID=UPI00363C38EE